MVDATSSTRAAAGALADLFFTANPQEVQEVNELRTKYRDWRQANGTVPHADVLDITHEAKRGEQRAVSKMRRVKTVGAKLDHSPPVRRRPPRRRSYPQVERAAPLVVGGPPRLALPAATTAPACRVARACLRGPRPPGSPPPRLRAARRTCRPLRMTP